MKWVFEILEDLDFGKEKKMRTLFGRRPVFLVSCLATSLVCAFGISAKAMAQSNATAQTTEEVTLYTNKSEASSPVMVLPSGQKIIIIQPLSVTIGKGVSIGQGVVIEGKPWHQVQLPNGQTGYLSGSVICSPSTNIAGTAGICAGQ